MRTGTAASRSFDKDPVDFFRSKKPEGKRFRCLMPTAGHETKHRAWCSRESLRTPRKPLIVGATLLKQVQRGGTIAAMPFNVPGGPALELPGAAPLLVPVRKGGQRARARYCKHALREGGNSLAVVGATSSRFRNRRFFRRSKALPRGRCALKPVGGWADWQVL